MKALYFELQTIESKAGEMLAAVEPLRERRRQQFFPDHSALLVLDLQNYFLTPSSHAFIPSAAAILPGIRDLVSLYVERKLPVYFTRHINTPANAGMMAKWWRDLIDTDEPAGQLHSILDGFAGQVIEKSQYDAFYNTELESRLRDQGVKQVVICGVMTHLCCETTARSAFMRGFEVFFTIDGTATYNEDFHRATLTNLTHGFAMPVLIAEILSAL